MSHLSPAEFVDFVDGALAPARLAHVESCPGCRAQAAALQSVMREAGAVDVPEPSPLFWDHLSARVRRGVDEGPRRFVWSFAAGRGLVPVGAAASLVLALLVGAVMTRRTVEVPSSMVVRQSVPATATGREDAVPEAAGTSEVWDVLTSVATDMKLEDADAAGMTVHSATIDRAVQGMSPDELQELGRLLQTELKRSSN
jgi:hypothetical protein